MLRRLYREIISYSEVITSRLNLSYVTNKSYNILFSVCEQLNVINIPHNVSLSKNHLVTILSQNKCNLLLFAIVLTLLAIIGLIIGIILLTLIMIIMIIAMFVAINIVIITTVFLFIFIYLYILCYYLSTDTFNFSYNYYFSTIIPYSAFEKAE
jgi:hypothetical protein